MEQQRAAPLTDEQRALVERFIKQYGARNAIMLRPSWRVMSRMLMERGYDWDDIDQICYVSVCNATRSWRPDGGASWETWAIRACMTGVNRVLTSCQSERRTCTDTPQDLYRRLQEARESTISDEVDEDREKERTLVREAVKRLPNRFQIAYTLRYQEGLSTAEAARQLKISRRRFESINDRLRQSIRRHLGRSYRRRAS